MSLYDWRLYTTRHERSFPSILVEMPPAEFLEHEGTVHLVRRLECQIPQTPSLAYVYKQWRPAPPYRWGSSHSMPCLTGAR